jgi:penicillin-binding protein 1A
MQVARNVYLSSEKTFTRKLYEVLLTFKLEHLLTKDQILEIYMNQIFLGNRAYGFAAASETYFGKPMKELTVAEAAMLAGLPKAPSAYNPISNPNRARSRQQYIIERMEENGFITPEQAEAAKRQELKVRQPNEPGPRARRVRGRDRAPAGVFPVRRRAYTRGLNVVTTVKSNDQEAGLPGPAQGHHGLREAADLPRPGGVHRPAQADRKELEDAIDDALAEHPDNGDVMSAVVLEAGPKKIVAVRQNGERWRSSATACGRPSPACPTRRRPRSRSAAAPSSA